MNKWIAGARPRTLPAAIAPVVVGTSLFARTNLPFNWLNAALALAVSLLLQIAVNYANDYSDGVRGTDEVRVGPVRLTASGLASPKAVKNAAYLSFFLAAICGGVLALRTSWVLIIVGAIAIIAAWGYTGTSKPYGYMGFGELSVFLFFGVVATMGSYFVQSEQVSGKAFLVAIPMGALSCAILAINNLRDRPKDAEVGKRTLAVRLGDMKARFFFVLLLISAHIAALLASFISPWALFTLALLPVSYSISKSVIKGAVGRDLIPLLGKTGRLQMLFALLLSLAFII